MTSTEIPTTRTYAVDLVTKPRPLHTELTGVTANSTSRGVFPLATYHGQKDQRLSSSLALTFHGVVSTGNHKQANKNEGGRILVASIILYRW